MKIRRRQSKVALFVVTLSVSRDDVRDNCQRTRNVGKRREISISRAMKSVSYRFDRESVSRPKQSCDLLFACRSLLALRSIELLQTASSVSHLNALCRNASVALIAS